MNSAFNRNLRISFGLMILLLVSVGFISYRTLGSLLQSDRAVANSNLVMLKLEKSISLMKDAETGQRGFLLTNQKRFLEPYNGAYQHALNLLNEVAGLTKDNAGQQANIDAIRHVMLDRLDILQKLIDKHNRGEAVTSTDLDEGKVAMDALRAAVDKAENEEQNLLNHRSAVLKEYSTLTPLVIIIVIVLAVAVAAIFYIRIIRDIWAKDKLMAQIEAREQETAGMNEELAATNEELRATNEELFMAREQISEVNLSLEARIAERTKELQLGETEARSLNEELTAANEEMVATNEELTESRQQLQHTLNQLIEVNNRVAVSEQLFRSIASNIPGSIIMVIDNEERLIAVEGDLVAEQGYNARELIGKKIVEIMPAERYEETKDLYKRMLANERFRIERKGRGDRVFKVDFVPLTNEKNEVYRGIIIAVDITDIKIAEERNLKLAAIVESTDDAVISKNLDSIITSWNKGAERMFGYTEKEMIGESVMKIIPKDRQDEEPVIIAQLKSVVRVDHYETKRLTRAGKLIDVSLTISPLLDSTGKVIGASKIVRDISEKKRDEQRKNDFIGMVSHELKTPLTSLTALMQVLARKLKDSEDNFVASAVSKANMQISKMAVMINGFLNVSRLESGKIMIDKKKFNLDELTTEMIDEAKLTVSSHEFEFSCNGPIPVDADRDKIGSVVSNLLSNAVKYSPRGNKITVKCELVDKEARVSVHDEGIGIKQEDINKLFERYYRVNTTQTRHISGFGIGLYLCAEIIQRHNGRIWAESKNGKGSTFYFTLPVS